MARRSDSDPGVVPEHNRSRLENAPTLDRITFRATDEQLAAIESLVAADVYSNRSEAIRAGLERLIEHHDRVALDDPRRERRTSSSENVSERRSTE